MIPLPSGTKIWLVAGITDMRNGFNGLAAKVQTALKDDPMSGHVFIFRGRSGSQVKLLWSTGDGLCLLTKRLERGRFAWPSARDGKVFLTQAQLAGNFAGRFQVRFQNGLIQIGALVMHHLAEGKPLAEGNDLMSQMVCQFLRGGDEQTFSGRIVLEIDAVSQNDQEKSADHLQHKGDA